MAEASDAFKTVAESASQLVSGEAIHAAFSGDVAGGSYSIFISSDKSVVRDLCVTAVTLYGIYTASDLMARAIDGIVNRGLGGPRNDQATGEIKKGSLHVKLHCFTDERFLEVWTDYESGKMKTRLQEEFTQCGIEIEGLKIKIENLEEVNDTKRAIESRLSTMAYRYEQGYDEKRFEGPVREDLFCSICQCVLRDPRTCQNREHAFCLSCISQHLRNSHTCPECREDLTPETLKIPRFLNNVLSELKIRCEFIERGCPGYVQLGNLQNHTERCGFAPVMCENEECGMVVNKRDKEIHERELCQFRIAKCHDCKDIKASQHKIKENVDEMKASQDGIKENVDEMKASQNEMQVTITEMERNQSQIRENVDEIKAENAKMERKQDEMNVKVNQMKENVDDIKVTINEMERNQSQIKENVEVMKVENAKMERKQDGINVKVNEMKENVDEIKQTQAEIKIDQVMFKAEVREQFERVTEMLNQLLQGRNVNNNGAQAMEPLVPANDQDIIILGGRSGVLKDAVLNTVEKFNIVEGKSTELPRMDQPRVASASCVYNNNIMVTGGYNGQDDLDSIEVLNMNQHPLRWMMFQGKLPFKLSKHVAIVYQDKLYVIGGYNKSENKTSDLIHELALAAPYSAKVLARMPQPRQNHRAEIVNGKLFIFGGRTTLYSKDATDSVLVYDFTTKKFKPCPSLPKPVWRISTVTWGNMIIVIGGADKNNQDLNDVIMYDTETGRSERLPSLNHKRCDHSAVIMHDVIVVFGGYNKEQKFLNSVETFTLGDDGWKELPGMKEKRYLATAVVKPRN